MHTWLPAFLFSCSYFKDTTKNHYNLASQIKTTEKQVLHTVRIIATPYCNFQTNTVYTRHRGIRKTYIVKFLFVLFSSAFLEKNCNEFAIMFWVHINLSKHNQLDRAQKYSYSNQANTVGGKDFTWSIPTLTIASSLLWKFTAFFFHLVSEKLHHLLKFF